MGLMARLICSSERPLMALATKMSMAIGGVVMPIARLDDQDDPEVDECLPDRGDEAEER